MLMPQDGLGHFPVAARAGALPQSIVVCRKPWRVDPDFHKMADADVLFEDGVRDLKSLAMLRMHSDSVHQLVVIGEALAIELLTKRREHLSGLAAIPSSLAISRIGFVGRCVRLVSPLAIVSGCMRGR